MLIIEASIVHEGNAWLGYDNWFRQAAAAANPNMQWSKTDTDLWHPVLQAWQKGQVCALLESEPQVIPMQSGSLAAGFILKETPKL